MSETRWLAYAQLLRLPNLFTALADIAVGTMVAQAVRSNSEQTHWPVWLSVFISSSSLYLSGMVWNDIFDRHEDARHRPYRPLPSRRVTLRSALLLGGGLLVLGIAAGWAAALANDTASNGDWDNSGLIASSLAAAILLYDGILKATSIGPWLMGGCRFGNVLLGLSPIPPEALPTSWRLHTAAVVGVYIVGVTWLARREETYSDRSSLRLAISLIAAALLLALGLRARLPEAMGTFLFPYLLVALGFYLGEPLLQALRQPSPRHVQAAVGRCLRGLILLDALLACAFIGWSGLLLVLLLPPARWLAQWIYVT